MFPRGPGGTIKGEHARRSLPRDSRDSREVSMLETVAVVFLLCWLLGLVTSYTMDGFIHVLLVVAVVIFLVRVIRGRRWRS